MPDTVLLTLGRLPKALDIARSFAGLGWRVVVAEPFPRHLAGASRAVARSVRVTAPAEDQAAWLREVAAIAAAERAALVVPVSEEVVHAAALRPHLPAETRLLAMPPEALLPLHDKAGFIDHARAHGLPVPDSALLGTAEAAAIAARGPCVVKPRRACSGRGVTKLGPGAPLPLPGPGLPPLVQAFVQGQEYSSCTLAHAGRVQRTAIYRGSLMSGTVSVGFERVDHPAIEEWIARFVASCGWSGFIAFDLILDAAGTPFGIECNPRTTSGLHFFETADIAPAILDPAVTPRLRAETRLQQFWSCLTETQHSFGDWPRFRANLRHLFGTRDVTWQAADPLPLVTMPWTAWPIISAAKKAGVPFGEVATIDVGWPGARV
jgi:predicted ATP-grasp superfamily ATP-dependent carboligase